MQSSLETTMTYISLAFMDLNDQTHEEHITVTGAVRWALIAPVTKRRAACTLAHLILQNPYMDIIIPGPRDLIYQGQKGL